MAPDTHSKEESNRGGQIITGHKISLNVHYDGQDSSTGKKDGNVTPIEEKMVNTGAISFIGTEKFTHVDNVVIKSNEENEQVSLHSSMHSTSSISEARPDTPETNSAHSDEVDCQTTAAKKLLAQLVESDLVVPQVTYKEYLNGPDQVIPSEALKTWSPSGAVKLAVSGKGIASYKPTSIPSLLKSVANRFPNKNALSVKRDGQWQHTTYSEYYQTSRTVAKAYIKLGLERFHGVCILGFNSPEWFLSNLGAIFAGGLSAGIYTTNSPEACQHCALNCKAQIWVVEDEKQLAKVLKIKKNLPDLKTIIQYSGKPTVDGVLSWQELLEIGQKENDQALEDRLKRMAVNQCCSLIYTSGTTGDPKGVMLSHDNMAFTAYANCLNIATVDGKEVIVSYLPLSHVAAQMADMYVTMVSAATTVFAQPDALKGTLVDTLKEARPTRFLGVPRVWEKMYEKMLEIGSKTVGLKKTIATWAKSVGLEANQRKERQDFSKPFGHTIASKVVFSKVKAALGLDRCKTFLSGAAPIGPEVIRYFHSLDVCLVEIYGMSESSGPHCCGLETAFKIGSVGRTVEGFYTKILNPDKEGNGEICMGGRNVSMGYLLQEATTHEAIDNEGWLHSGDVGRIDGNGYLFITGRIKEIIITAGGENIPPVLIEDILKSELPCISNAMLIGDKRKFLSILLTLKTTVDEDGEPLDALTRACIDWCRSVGSEASTIQDVVAPDAAVMKAIQDGIDRTNKQATSNAQKIQKWTILPRDFTVAGDELGPTLKLKRPIVAKKYSETIERFYA